MPQGGNNPEWGRDQFGAPTAGNGPYGYGFGANYGGAMGQGPHMFQYQYLPQQATYGPYFGIPVANPQQRGYAYLAGFGGGNRYPTAQPIINPDLPATNMTNSTGGVGCEPGYNYFFSPEHTKIHVLKSGSTPPWQLPANMTVPFHACHVPVSTTIAELLKGFGATNPVPKKNRITEVVQGGNGKWYRGVSFCGEVAKDMQKTLKDVGWDKSRTGLHGQKPVVVLYVTKD